MGKTVLVTGGAGFIGSHLCSWLLNMGNEVICMDNCFSGKKQNIREFLTDSRFEFIRHDITFPVYLEVDEIYNLACPASPVYYQMDPVQTVKTSIHGAINVLGLAKRTGAKIFQASTSEVYGNPEKHPQKESYWGNVNPIGIRACYDEGKRCAETLFFSYYQQHEVDVRIGRIFNTYGPKMYLHDGRVISNFIVQALNNEPMTIYGDGSQTRSFCYVDDMIKGIISLMGSDFPGPINLGNPTENSIVEVAYKIIELTNSDSSIIFKELPEDDPFRRNPDISLARKKLGWEPQINLSRGLKETIEYFKNLMEK